jgi:hypothetical protein
MGVKPYEPYDKRRLPRAFWSGSIVNVSKSFSEMSKIFVICLPHFARNRPLLMPACTAWRDMPSFFAAWLMVNCLGKDFFIWRRESNTAVDYLSNTQQMAVNGDTGLHQALQLVFPKAPLQRFWAHKTRNVLDKVKKMDQPAVKREKHYAKYIRNDVDEQLAWIDLGQQE